MSQHDLTIDNQGFPAFRADLNNALQALGSIQSGTSAPTPTFANQPWYDTTNNQLKIRNEDNDAWITLLTLDQVADVTSGVGAKTLPTGTIVGTSDSQTLTNKTINASQLVDNSVTPAKLSTEAQYTGFKNRIINGGMVFDQRNSGSSVTITGTNISDYVLDRWMVRTNSATGSKISVQRSTTAPTGFSNSQLITSLSAYSIGSTEHFGLIQHIEGFNVSDLGWGTASAKPITLSFKVRSSLTGTFGGFITNGAGNRWYIFSYTINSANTFEDKSITILGDTTGSWTTDNNIGLTLSFSVAAGSSTTTTAGSWGTDLYRSVTGQTSLVGTNGATFYITGVQLEVGSTATSFDYRPYGTELMLCQRYLPVWYGGGDQIVTMYNSDTGILGSFKTPVPVRSAITGLTFSTNANSIFSAYDGFKGGYSPTNGAFNSGGINYVTVQCNSTSLGTGRAGLLRVSDNQWMYGTGCEL